MSDTTFVTIQIDHPAPTSTVSPDGWRWDTVVKSFAWREMAIDEHKLEVTRLKGLLVLAIDHRHGTEISLHASQDGVRDALAAWATEHWADKIGDTMPSKEHRARMYFTHPNVEEREAFLIQRCEIRP